MQVERNTWVQCNVPLPFLAILVTRVPFFFVFRAVFFNYSTVNSIGNWIDKHDGDITRGVTSPLKFLPDLPWELEGGGKKSESLWWVVGGRTATTQTRSSGLHCYLNVLICVWAQLA